MVRLEDHPAFVTSIRSVGSSLQLPVPCQALTQCIRDLGARLYWRSQRLCRECKVCLSHASCGCQVSHNLWFAQQEEPL